MIRPVQDHNAVRILHCGQSVGNYERCSSVHQFIHSILHDLFRSRINGAGGFIQDQHRRIRYCRTCNGQKLSLSLTQSGSASGQHRIISLRQSLNKSISIGKFCCRVDFFIISIQFSVADVILYSSCKQTSILENDSKRSSKIRFFNLLNINSIISDLTILNIIETIDQVRNRRLSGSGRSYKGNLLPRTRFQFDIMEYDLSSVYPKSTSSNTTSPSSLI